MATPTGAVGDGAFTGSALANGTGVVVWGPQLRDSRRSCKVGVRANATGAFRLLCEVTDGTNFYSTEEVDSDTAIAVTASYTQKASGQFEVPSRGRVRLYNDSGGNIDYAVDVVEYAT